MADNFQAVVVQGLGTAVATFRATDVGGGTLGMMSIPMNKLGTALIGSAVMSNAIPVTIATDQPALPVSGTITAVLSNPITAVVSGTVTSVISGTPGVNVTQIGGVALGFGQAVMATSLPVAIASNQIVTTLLSNASVTALLAQGGNIAAIKAGTTAPTAADAALVVAISPNSVNANGQATMANSAPVVIASNQSSIPVAGDVASGSADSGNPVKLGAVGHTTAPTAVGDGQRVNLVADKVGRLQVVGAPRSLLGNQTTALTTAAETVIVNAINATTFADLYGAILANKSATAAEVSIRYGVGSTIVTNIYVPASDTRGFMLSIDAAIPGSLSTANVSWTAQASATSSIDVTALYVKNI